METKLAQYANGDNGYNAMLEDFKALFNWDGTYEYGSGNDMYTEFQMQCSRGLLVGLRMYKHQYHPPCVVACFNNASSPYYAVDAKADSINTFKNVAYAYGNDFFVVCGSTQSFPASEGTNVGYYNCISGVARCRNMLTGNADYCSFSVVGNAVYFFTGESMDGGSTSWNLCQNASVGAAISLHAPQQLYVADNVLLLTAIPDTITACLSTVLFNGTPYMRLGRILIPAETP